MPDLKRRAVGIFAKAGGNPTSGGGTGTGSGGGPVPGNGQGKGKHTIAQRTELVTIQSDTRIRLRYYETDAAATADMSRKLGTPASHHQAVLFEAVLEAGVPLDVNPYAVLKNGDSPQTSDIYVVLDNPSGAPVTPAITFTHIPF